MLQLHEGLISLVCTVKKEHVWTLIQPTFPEQALEKFHIYNGGGNNGHDHIVSVIGVDVGHESRINGWSAVLELEKSKLILLFEIPLPRPHVHITSKRINADNRK